MQLQCVRANVLTCQRRGDEIFGQCAADSLGDGPARHIVTEHILNHILLELLPLTRPFKVVMSGLHSSFGAHAKNSVGRVCLLMFATPLGRSVRTIQTAKYAHQYESVAHGHSQPRLLRNA